MRSETVAYLPTQPRPFCAPAGAPPGVLFAMGWVESRPIRFLSGGAPVRERMIRNNVCSKYSLVCAGLLLLFSLSTYSASGQVSFPGLHSDPHFSLFGTFTNLKPDYQYYGDYAAVGFTSGAFLQTSHILGWEGRGSITRWQGLEHQETLLVGPRAALHFGHISPYVCFLGGGANGWRWQIPRLAGQPEPKLIEGFGPQWSTVGGLDVHLTGRFVLRVGEISYSKTYLKNWALTPISASAGFVYRLK